VLQIWQRYLEDRNVPTSLRSRLVREAVAGQRRLADLVGCLASGIREFGSRM